MMRTALVFLVIPISIFISFPLFGQQYEKTDERPAYLVDIHYGVGIPMGDLADRFGYHNALGVTPAYMSVNGWIYGMKGRYFFGNTVTEEGIVQNLLTEQGFIIGNDRSPSTLVLKERGWVFNAVVGKLFDFAPSAARAGLRIDAGIGVMWHRIRLQDDSRSIIQLFEPFDKGYDRLTGGPMGMLDVSYQYMAANRGLNFRVGMNYNYASTENLRGFNYDTRMRADEKRTDHFISFYASFILPIYGSNDPSKIYY